MENNKSPEESCGKQKNFFEKNPAIRKTILLFIIAIFFITLEYLFKLTDNQIFKTILKEEKNIVAFFLNQTFDIDG